MKAQPDELRALEDDLKRIRQDHANVIAVEPKGTIQEPMDGILRYVKKRYADLSEGRPKE